MKYFEAIEELKNLNLSSYPVKEIKSLFKEFGQAGAVITTLPKRKKILRARINKDSEHFNSILALSYKPKKFNTTYQRASTPISTMFYGSIVPEILGRTEPETARITALMEISDFVRDTGTIGKHKITFSVWEVVEDIHLVSLIHHKKFERQTELTKQLQNEYSKFIKNYPELEKASIDISEFLAEQFAKPVEKENDFDYLLSALYTEFIVKYGYDGVLYPSVKLAGEGINIAVKPELIGTRIKFIHAGECTVYKNGKSVFVGNDTYAKIDKDGNIEFEKAPDGIFTSEEFGLKRVGLK